MVTILSEQNNVNAINWVNGLSDPGEMIRCAYLPELRRLENEADTAYAARITPLVMALPAEERDKIMGAAINRAGYDVSTGKVAMFSAREVPWAALGKVISSAATSAEALHLAVQDWTVTLQQSYAFNPTTQTYTKAEGSYHTVRSDTGAVITGKTVGRNYHPFQNVEAYNLLDTIVGEKLAMFETAGCLNGGAQVWMLCKIPKEYFITPEDQVMPYVLLTNSHDGTGALKMLPTTVRVVCKNTLNLSMRNGHKSDTLSVRHNSNLNARVEEARKNLGLIGKRLDNWQEEAAALARLQVNAGQTAEYFDVFFPTRVKPVEVPNTEGAALLDSMLGTVEQKQSIVAELLTGHYAESERQATRNRNILEIIMENYENDIARGTAWGLFNSCSEWVDHQRSTRGRDESERANNRLDSVWFGSGNALKQEMYSTARAMLATA
jgi:phage/plasmid-like protein (TIGR03299 family)